MCTSGAVCAGPSGPESAIGASRVRGRHRFDACKSAVPSYAGRRGWWCVEVIGICRAGASGSMGCFSGVDGQRRAGTRRSVPEGFMNDAPGQERLRLINALVAEKVMGWRVCDRTDVQDGTWWADAAGTCIRRVDKFEPTNSWESAGQVVEKMDQLGWGMVHWLGWPLSSAGRGHAVRFYRAVHPPHWEE